MKYQHWEKAPWHSSYEENNYGEIFYSLMRIYRPNKVIELGTKAGYSAYHIARGLDANKKGKLYCYDLWEKYPFHSVPITVALQNLKKFKDIVRLRQRDAVGVNKLHKSVDILHVDISNDGKILDKLIPYWINKVRQFIIIEGGSKERDKVYWMDKYHKVPITNWLKDFSLRYNVEYFVIEPFPSVIIMHKKS
jgi:hypothetical protein